jgi:hypothetical protein
MVSSSVKTVVSSSLPAATSFVIVAESDAQLPLRILTPLARRDLVPTHFRIIQRDEGLHIEIGLPSRNLIDPERFADDLRRLVGVRKVMAIA